VPVTAVCCGTTDGMLCPCRDYEAMCRDYYTLDFMDPSVDTAPIAPALRVSQPTAANTCISLVHALPPTDRCSLNLGPLNLHHPGRHQACSADRCCGCCTAASGRVCQVDVCAPCTTWLALLWCLLHVDGRPSLMMCWMPAWPSSTSRLLLMAWEACCSSTHSGACGRRPLGRGQPLVWTACC